MNNFGKAALAALLSFSFCSQAMAAFTLNGTRFIYEEGKKNICKRKLTAVCSHQTRIGNLDAHLI